MKVLLCITNLVTLFSTFLLSCFLLNVCGLQKYLLNPCGSFASLPTASLLPCSLGILRVFCFEGVSTSEFVLPDGHVHISFSSFASWMVLLLAVMEIITTILECVSRAACVSHAFGEGLKQRRKGQHMACLWCAHSPALTTV